ncbi:hypothetical protein ACJQWK_05503, partial [Exserohilum turcicum]
DAVVAHAHYRASCVLQLNQVLLILIHLRLINLTNLVLIPLAKRLPYHDSPNANSRMTVVQRVQLYP